ncbi:MAG: DUF3168 domain-containing protein [Alphaproteobacteria bacterium]|nr:MAG: DUF3168 domain-containing protein [Alphaproteobacteria bacterium]
MSLEALAALQTALVTRLSGDPAVGAIAPVVHETPPSDAVPPYLALAPFAAEDRSTKSGRALRVRIIVRLALDTQTDAAIFSAAKTVRSALADPPVVIEGAFRLVRLDLRSFDLVRPRHGGREGRLGLVALLAER